MPLKEVDVRLVASPVRESDYVAFHRVEGLTVAELGAQLAADPQPVPGVHAQVAEVKHTVHVRPEQQSVVEPVFSAIYR